MGCGRQPALCYLFERKAALLPALERLVAWADERRIAPLPVREYALDDVANAHRAIESGGTVGKLALVTR